MKPKTLSVTAMLAVSVLMLPPVSQAQMAVIDVASLTQLLQQIQTMEKVLDNARSQLAQAQQALLTMTGTRGMQLLMSGVVRNYLPTDWQQLTGSLQSLSSAYPALAASIAAQLKANAVLSPAQLSALSVQGQQRIQGARTLAATSQAMSRDALSNSASRFADLQGLISAIGATTDQKSILELSARIAAEQGMLQNEQNKLQALFESAQAEDLAMHQQEREAIVAGHGSFASRFQPSP
jgi:type IV secretion system protein VirB5